MSGDYDPAEEYGFVSKMHRDAVVSDPDEESRSERYARRSFWVDQFLYLGLAMLAFVIGLSFTGFDVAFYVCAAIGVVSCIISLIVLWIAKNRP